MYPRELSFDRSGSARIRFFGKNEDIVVHWAKADVKQLALICPGEKCLVCRAKSDPSPCIRRIGFGWDVKAKKWCLYVNSIRVFADIWVQASKCGATPESFQVGLGPEVLLQRVNGKTEVAVVPETIGKGEGLPATRPSIEEFLSAARKKSVYLKLDSAAKVESEFPQTGAGQWE
jgi:hypothetical protein